MTLPPPDDGPLRPDDALTWDWVVPDDISALQADIDAYRREQQHVRHRQQRQRLVPRSWRHYGVSVPMLVVSLLLLGSLSGLAVMFGPRPDLPRGPTALPLTDPAVAPGRVGGLLPAVTVTTAAGVPVATLTLQRPSVLLVVPAGCACQPAVGHALAAATPYLLAQYVVTRSVADARRYTSGGNGAATGLVDSGGALLHAYAADGTSATMVVVGPDGAVRSITPGLGPATALTLALDAAVGPTLAPSTAR